MADQVPRKWTLKVEFDGEVRRLRGWPEDGREPTYEAIHSGIEGLFDQPQASPGSFFIQFHAQDAVLHRLSEDTLLDALNTADASGVLRLVAERVAPIETHAPRTIANDSTVPATVKPSSSSELDGVTLIETSAPPYAASGSPLPTSALGEPLLPSDADSVSSSTPARSDSARLVGASCKAAERMVERLSVARPQLTEGLDLFKQQVMDDFRSNSKDMQGAFDSSRRPVGEQPQATQIVGTVAGAVAGVMAAGRLMPIRASRLAAHSVVAVGGGATPADPGTIPTATGVDAGSAAPTAADARDSPPDSAAGMPVGITEEINHFKQQVSQDFELTRQEVRAVFGYFTDCTSTASAESSYGGSGSEMPAEDGAADAQARPVQHQLSQLMQRHVSKEKGLAVATTVAGLTAGVGVASTLLPLRATRLAVATATAFAGSCRASSGQTPPSDRRRALSAQEVANVGEAHMSCPSGPTGPAPSFAAASSHPQTAQ